MRRIVSKRPAVMWDLRAEDLRNYWAAPKIINADPNESSVALVVANTMLEDCPHLLKEEDLEIPNPTGDDWRAEQCLLWLVRQALPAWLPEWARRNNHRRLDEILRVVRELENVEGVGQDTGEKLLALYFVINQEETIHRRSMHAAQGMGVRAFYRGACSHSTMLLNMPAMAACRVIVRAVPSDDTWEKTALIRESTQSSALLMLDRILKEIPNAPTT